MTDHYTEAERLLRSTRDGVEEDDEIGAAQVHAMLAVVDELTRVPNPAPTTRASLDIDNPDMNILRARIERVYDEGTARAHRQVTRGEDLSVFGHVLKREHMQAILAALSDADRDELVRVAYKATPQGLVPYDAIEPEFTVKHRRIVDALLTRYHITPKGTGHE